MQTADVLRKYKAVRFGYANNGSTVTFVAGEQWCWDGVEECPTCYKVNWGREYRYDGARQRYFDRKLRTSNLFVEAVGGSTTWTDYDGDSAYNDFVTVGSGTGVDTSQGGSYEPGQWRRMKSGTNFTAEYLHGDMLGTLRHTTTAAGATGSADAFTAFGERIAGTADRHGYVGAHGYQATLESGAEVFPFLHLGHRYYDPSSGRFLQRDPIGIRGGSNVYGYANQAPSSHLDSQGAMATKVLKVFAKTVKGFWRRVNPDTATKQARKGKPVKSEGTGARKDAKKRAEDAFSDNSPVVEHGPHKEGQMPHYQPKSGDGRHWFYVPGAGAGTWIFGDNWFGEAVEFFNPASDLQELYEMGCDAWDYFAE